ncbi:uncharacterized protein ACRADG_013119 isoform 2-T2 [Cochliomyia hominivorax]
MKTNLDRDIIHDAEIDILIQLMDDFNLINSTFHQERILINTIQHLLKSDQRQYRKCAYYLLKKMLQYLIANDHNNQIENSWIIYITIMENLEEEQSHLILPSLENLKILCENKCLQSFWLDILYMRILTHNNNLVLRWSIEFILNDFSCSDLSRDTLKHFLQATNSNLLFNYEGYFLKEELFYNFLKNDLQNVLTLLPEIDNWKSIPLYMWLNIFNKSTLPKHLTYEGVLKISACVRKLQNSIIRNEAIKICNELFKEIIDSMSMEEYVTYVETLYNVSDCYNEHKKFFDKKSSLLESKTKDETFKQRFYEIFINNFHNMDVLLEFLNDLPISKHGWLKFAPFQFQLDEFNCQIVKNLYEIDLNNLKRCDFQTFIKCFENSLLEMKPYDKHEERMCHQAAISQYVFQKPDLIMLNEDEVRFILNSQINKYAVGTFTKKLLKCANEKMDLWIIDELLKYEHWEVFCEVFDYLNRFCDIKMIDEYAVKVFNVEEYKYLIVKNFDDKWANFKKHFINTFLERVVSKGETRIEESFIFHSIDNKHIFKRTTIPLEFLNTLKEFFEESLDYHIELSKKKPRYFENSNEHRIKMRIAFCINCFFSLCDYKEINYSVLDKMWNIIINENNQLNITYFYEVTLGYFENREKLILNKLKEAQTLTSTQQVSIISVTYGYFLNKTARAEVYNEVISYLLALTMGANFQTRLVAQMTLYKLLKLDKFREIGNRQQIIDSIEYASGEKLQEYLDDIRFYLHTLKYDNYIFSTILFITNAPFDESYQHYSLFNPVNLNYYREKFMKKFKCVKSDDTMITNTIINQQLQRKMNPVNDLTKPQNLIIYPIEEKISEMYVIASLIDKLPNLGGIARTCEVLGIQNLVMDSKMHTEKSDFKNLSMTAEKSLNIIEVKPKVLNEFLMTKKLEGFSIIGAEQTNNSQNFADFKFPQKSVLLLGHEKDGIPAPLLGLLDYAVEIPQFGLVRSLNVHVTGALFMWEYCKQHLIKQHT